jgi:hypothetical protein
MKKAVHSNANAFQRRGSSCAELFVCCVVLIQERRSPNRDLDRRASGRPADIGFAPAVTGRPLAAMRQVASASIDHGWRVPAVKWLMVESLFTAGVAIYGFYALQPYLLEL